MKEAYLYIPKDTQLATTFNRFIFHQHFGEITKKNYDLTNCGLKKL